MSLTDREALMHSFKTRVSAVICEMGERILEDGGSPEDVALLNRNVMAEAMLLAAFMHDGNESSRLSAHGRYVDQAGAQRGDQTMRNVQAANFEHERWLDEIVSLSEAAKLRKISLATLRIEIRAGRLKVIALSQRKRGMQRRRSFAIFSGNLT